MEVGRVDSLVDMAADIVGTAVEGIGNAVVEEGEDSLDKHDIAADIVHTVVEDTDGMGSHDHPYIVVGTGVEPQLDIVGIVGDTVV